MSVALGNGRPDPSAVALRMEGVLREQGLLFPYMLCLQPKTSPPQKQPAHPPEAIASAAEEARLLASVGMTEGEAVVIAQSAQQSPGWTESRAERDLRIKREVLERRERQAELQRRREENVARIEAKRSQKEREHLEACERHERLRRERRVKEQQEKVDRERRHQEQIKKKEYERQIELRRKEEEQRLMFEQCRRDLDLEAQRREGEVHSQEAERIARLTAARQQREKDAEKRKEEIEAGREARVKSTLASVLGKLDGQIKADSEEAERMQLQERELRQRRQQEQFEQTYVQRVERDRQAKKERERSERKAQALRALEETQAREMEENLRAQETKRIESEKIASWRQRRRELMDFEEAEKEQLQAVAVQMAQQSKLPKVAGPGVRAANTAPAIGTSSWE